MENNDPSKLSIFRRIRFLAKDSALYGGAAALNKAFGLITFPILARYFSVEDYGTIDFFNVLVALLGTMIVFGQDSAIARYFYEYEDRVVRREIISQSFVFQSFLLVLVLPIIWFFGEIVVESFINSSVTSSLLKLIILQIPFHVVLGNARNILKWSFQRSKYLTLMIGSVVFRSTLMVIGVVYMSIDIVDLFCIYLSSEILFALLGIWYIRGWISIPRNLFHLRELLPFGMPLGLIGFLGVFIMSSQRGIVVSLLGDFELGLYAAGTKIAMMISLPINAFQVAWGPFSYSIFKQSNAAVTYNWALKGFVIMVGISVVMLTLFGDRLLILLSSNRYEGAAIVILPLSLGLAVQGTSWITGIGIGLAKKSYLALYAYGFYLLVGLSAMLFLGKQFGLGGVAWGMLMAYVARGVVESFLSQRVYPLAWSFTGVSCFLLGALVLGSVSQKIARTYNGLGFTMTFVILLVIMIVFGWYLFSKAEREKILSTLRIL